ncbi:MAG TPA: enoyl-ACP reductase [Chitinispirillaceae bacterium]|nr:enoyl-ACP reductase [Chitinispirillaceae bacterium]
MNYHLLRGKKGVIFGALNENSIAWKVAERCYEEGADIVLTNAPVALRMGEVNELAKKLNTKVIPADATNLHDLEKLFSAAMKKFGGQIDFILHSIGMSPNVRKGIPYDQISYENYEKTLDISALSFHKVLQTCKKLDALKEWASVVALTYIAAQRTMTGYNDMADAKAVLESIARSFGHIYGIEKKVRINTISQSPTMTTAGSGIRGFDSYFDFADKMSPLGNATALECADYCITLFSDLTRKVTMQNLFHDGGFSSMAMSEGVIRQYERNLKS